MREPGAPVLLRRRGGAVILLDPSGSCVSGGDGSAIPYFDGRWRWEPLERLMQESAPVEPGDLEAAELLQRLRLTGAHVRPVRRYRPRKGPATCIPATT